MQNTPLYRKITNKLALDIQKWTSAEKVLAYYLLTNKHCNRIGLYEIPLYIGAHENNMRESDYRKAMQKCLDEFRWGFDEKAGVVFIRTFFTWNPPGTWTHLSGALSQLIAVPDTPLIIDFAKVKKQLPEYCTEVKSKQKYNLWDIFDDFVQPKIAKHKKIHGDIPPDEPKPPEHKKEKVFSPEIERLYESCYKTIVDMGHSEPSSDSAKKTNKDALRLLIDADGATGGQIQHAMAFAWQHPVQNNGFCWRNQIQSCANLRRLWKSVWPQANDWKPGPQGIDAPLSAEETARQAQIRREVFRGDE